MCTIIASTIFFLPHFLFTAIYKVLQRIEAMCKFSVRPSVYSALSMLSELFSFLVLIHALFLSTPAVSQLFCPKQNVTISPHSRHLVIHFISFLSEKTCQKINSLCHTKFPLCITSQIIAWTKRVNYFPLCVNNQYIGKCAYRLPFTGPKFFYQNYQFAFMTCRYQRKSFKLLENLSIYLESPEKNPKMVQAKNM